jgi:hypothetical protein
MWMHKQEQQRKARSGEQMKTLETEGSIQTGDNLDI